MYQPTVHLLNTISKNVYDSFKGDTIRGRKKQRLLFLDHHHGPPAFHPCGSNTKPDFIGVWGEEKHYEKYRTGANNTFLKVPCHEACTVGELKPKRDQTKGSAQTISYLWPLMQARPDMPGVYAFYGNLKHYQIIWADAAEPIASPLVGWDKLDLLMAYVYSMYDPPPRHYLYDPTISLTKAKHGFDPANVTYTIVSPPPRPPPRLGRNKGKGKLPADDNHKPRTRVYQRCKPVHWGAMWGRRSMVFIGQPRDNPDSFAVIKNSYRSDRRRFIEVEIIGHIHAEGTVPGVVRLINGPGSTNVQMEGGVLCTAPRGPDLKAHPDRTLDRLEMRSRGLPLHKAKSLLDLLKAAYDILEVHRFLVLKRSVLHRDFSINNVLMYPEHEEGPDGKEIFIKDPPKFIDEVLPPFGERDDSRDYSRGLLIDFDNSSMLGGDIGKELTLRTGTPKYISRAVAAQKPLDHSSARDYVPMPELLKQRARVLYKHAYGNATYDKYCDPAAGGVFHGGRLPSSKVSERLRTTNDDDEKFLEMLIGGTSDPPPSSPAPEEQPPEPEETRPDAGDTPTSSQPQFIFYHRMDHDAESLFWVLFHSLIRAQPQGEPEQQSPALSAAWQKFAQHAIVDCKEVEDSRNGFFLWSEQMCRNHLHPKLAHIAPFLAKMIEQVRPEYGYLDPPPCQEHLHEAMRRLLLDAIVEITENKSDVALDPDHQRPVDGWDDELPTAKTGGTVGTGNGKGKRKREDDDDDTAGGSSKRINSPYETRTSSNYVSMPVAG
ncbi:hypothetical protein K474DRAFT_621111 [Panus rudis PR-1116 ss-1]|nr:hypothetical protein K474DRAFT_621111 [Panus rudis PR-1116 ss-1]